MSPSQFCNGKMNLPCRLACTVFILIYRLPLAAANETKRRAAYAESLGHQAIAKKRHNEATQHFAAAWDLDGRRSALRSLADVYLLLGRSAESLLVLNRLAGTAPALESKLYLETETAQAKSMLDHTDKPWEAWGREAENAMHEGKHTQAVLASARLALTAPSQYAPIGYFNMGQALRRSIPPKNEEALLYFSWYIEDGTEHIDIARENKKTLHEIVFRQYALPVYRRAWFWAVLGTSVAVVSTATTLASVYGRQPPQPLPNNIDIAR